MIEFSSPSLRTGRADLPHPALRLVVHLRRGLTYLRMGDCQREQAMLDKESVWPAMMIQPAAAPTSTVTNTENAAQAHTDPTIQDHESKTTAVLEVLKPSFHGPIDLQDDDRQAIAVRPFGFLANGILKLLETLSSRPPLT